MKFVWIEGFGFRASVAEQWPSGYGGKTSPFAMRVAKQIRLYAGNPNSMINHMTLDNPQGSLRQLADDPSETARRTPSFCVRAKRRGMIQSDLHGNMQSAAEMSAPRNNSVSDFVRLRQLADDGSKFGFHFVTK